MFNVLTDEAKKSIRREYILRTLAVTLFLVSGAIAIGAVSFAPTLIFSYEKKVELGGYLSAAAEIKAATSTASFNETVKNLQTKINALALVDTNTEPHITIDKIMSLKVKGITISSIVISPAQQGGPITVSGTAKTRNDLLVFQKNLKKDLAFNQADFPYDLLAKQDDIIFTMTLK